MTPTMAANGPAMLSMIWSPEWGFHWDAIANYILFLGFFGMPLYKCVNAVFDFLRKGINKIQFTFMGVRIDFSKYYWDDAILEYARSLANTLVASKQADAKKIKLDYDHKISAAMNQTEALNLHTECREKLEALTTSGVEDFKLFDPELWQAMITKCKNEQKATELVKAHLKAEVVERKNGSSADISLTRAIGKRGNGASPVTG